MNVQWDRGAIQSLTRTSTAAAALALHGTAVRNEARRNAAALGYAGRHLGGSPQNAIVTEPGADALSIYVDVGYARHHPGFVLWWAEVGTRHQGARPHLRPAVRPGLIS